MSITTKWLRIMIIESHRLISVKPSGYSRSFAPIFRNDPMGFLGQSGYPPVPHDSWLLVALIEWPREQTRAIPANLALGRRTMEVLSLWLTSVSVALLTIKFTGIVSEYSFSFFNEGIILSTVVYLLSNPHRSIS